MPLFFLSDGGAVVFCLFGCMVGSDVVFGCVSNKVVKAKMGGVYTTFEYAIYQHFNGIWR